ncbi:Uncharacterised protein [Mycobacteroides abscessus subsp. abscessus]|nr:Uncharacterised protein [Mycobacteroides abscessus subsp. abscessus]
MDICLGLTLNSGGVSRGFFSFGLLRLGLGRSGGVALGGLSGLCFLLGLCGFGRSLICGQRGRRSLICRSLSVGFGDFRLCRGIRRDLLSRGLRSF